jgi:hypothetical protein
MSALNDCVAVIDLGSARTKMLLASRTNDGEFSVRRYKEETGAAGKLGQSNLLEGQAVEGLHATVNRLVALAYEAGCRSSISVATDAFRASHNGREVIDGLEQLLGSISILDPQTEGLIFYSAIAELLQGSESFCLLDVGGGSVQIVWGDSAERVKSIPTGTFRLERDFQKDSAPTPSVYEQMRRYIEDHVKRALPEELRTPLVVFGSNCMEEFLTSALGGKNGGVARVKHELTRIPVGRIEKLFEEIKGRPYETLGGYYPANPFFMHGADKALLNLLVITSLLGAKEIIPTDESLGTAIARLALSAPQLLDGLGLCVERLKPPPGAI